ncbi:MAG: hypothetical protein ABFD96_18490 [Armatimonadia bacterium]
MRYRLFTVVVVLFVSMSLTGAWAQSKDVLQAQVRGLLEQVKQLKDPAAKAQCLQDAEQKATYIIEKIDPRFIPANWALTKIAWYFGEPQRTAQYAELVERYCPPTMYKDIVSEVRYLKVTPNNAPLMRIPPPPPPNNDPYGLLVTQAAAAEQAGRLDEARSLYYAAHQMRPTGESEPQISTALSRMTVEMAEKCHAAANWSETWRLVSDYLKTYGDVDPNERVIFMAVVSSQQLNYPDQMKHWAEFYAQHFANGPSIAAIKTILGEVDDSYYERTLVSIRLALQAKNTNEAMRLIEDAKKHEVPGTSGGEVQFLYGVYYANAPEKQYNKAREAFKSYITTVPNGKWVYEAYKELQWLDQPLVLFTAAKVGGAINELLLWTMRPDGSDPRNITNDQAGYIEIAGGQPLVAVSPDNSRIAFVTRAPGGNITLFVSNVDGSERNSIWTSRQGFVQSLEWAPNSPGLLKFHGLKDAGDLYNRTWDPSRTQANPIDQSRTAPGDAPQLVSAWSPTGACLAWRTPNGTLSLTTPTETKDIQFTAIRKSWPKLDPRVLDFVWTLPRQDGAAPILIACTPTSAFKLDLKSSEIATVNAAHFLGFTNQGSRAGSWQIMPKGEISAMGCSSDGDSVAFLVGDELQIYRINPDSTPREGGPRALPMVWVCDIPQVNAFEFSPEGSRLAYRTNRGVFISRFDGFYSNDNKVEGTGATTSFFWSPRDGQLLTADSGTLVVTYDRFKLIQAFTPTNDTIADKWVGPKWSPDSRIVAVNKVNAEGSSLVFALRQATASARDWRNICPTPCQPGTLGLVGWLSSL